MNKQEISEIKKLFSKENSRITRITGCYINAEKEKQSELAQTFGLLPEEEMFKYMEIFRKTLSGTIGKNLINMEFPLSAEEEGGTVPYLLDLRDSALKDEEILESFYDRINQNYLHPENYLILLIHGAYDIPRKGKDNLEMDDASDYIYNFILCALCPVNLAKPALAYNGDINTFTSRTRDWVVGMPEIGFLYPAFEDRQTDIHKLLYYAKDSETLHPELTDSFELTVPETAKSQKAGFDELIQSAMGEEATMEAVKSVQDSLSRMVEERSDAPDPVVFSKYDVRLALEESGISGEQMESFDEKFEQTLGEMKEIPAANVVNTRKFEVKTPEVTVSVSPERKDLVETRVIDGIPYLLIPITDEVEVNGIALKKWD